MATSSILPGERPTWMIALASVLNQISVWRLALLVAGIAFANGWRITTSRLRAASNAAKHRPPFFKIQNALRTYYWGNYVFWCRLNGAVHSGAAESIDPWPVSY